MFSETKMNANWHIHLILKCHLNFRLHNILEKSNIVDDENKILICNRKLSIKRKYFLVSYVSPNVEVGSPIHCIHFKSTNIDLHKNIKGLQVQLIAQVAFDCILFGKSSLKNSYTWWNEYIFLPKLHKFRPICGPVQIATTYAPSLKYGFVLTLTSKCIHKCQEFSLTHVIFFFNVLKFQQYPFEPQFGICDSVTIIAWIITRAKKFGCIEY